MESFKSINILKYKNGLVESFSDSVIVEYILKLYVNAIEFASFFCTPLALDCLVVGYLQSQGIIEKKEDIKRIFIEEREGKAHVEILKSIDASSVKNLFIMSSGEKNICFHDQLKIGKTCCHCNFTCNPCICFPEQLNIGPITSNIKYKLKDIINLSERFNNGSGLFKITGGVHSCAIADDKDFIIFHEDIGRHNAFDKAFGQALLDGIDLQDKAVFTSGRISVEMLLKAAKRKVPVVVSISAPTALAVEVGRKLNITIAGFARGDRLNIYSCPERFVW
ncbi:hydrogen dependent carbon dioxide reductase subunit FdhD [Thermoanaerobacter kivui]|uniref:Sulfur carrier protein FdhD n=1 Tax=Thermoanaerobacter kivui TaxID=2325 RepID=A0A097ATL7_THEKI|nr:formate dehydrogenase accessory sulfurtransferase FdhD [Thermoanaerobacter kivui]AIS53139.1 hydrogen dependent carbon dioxide reductase subunit FdhD [Thermoanaerobacter kivui]